MASMNITKSKFMEYIRCKRYPTLNNIHKRKDMDDASRDRFYDIIESLEGFDKADDDFLEPDLSHLEVMMPYFTHVELLAARKVMSLFGGETRYGLEYGTQKMFMRDLNNFNLMCYVDVFNRNEKGINIVEVKATTSNKFLNLGWSEDGVKTSIFYVGDNNILRLKEEIDPDILGNKKYIKNRNKLLNRFTDEGVYVYDLAFQRYVIEEDINDAKYYLGVINHDYVFDGTYIDGEPLYTDDSIRLVDLTKITKELLPKIKDEILEVIYRITEDDESRVRLGKHCQLKKMRECIYKDLCYDRFPKKNSILMYMGKHNGFKDPEGEKHDVDDLVQEGYLSMVDIPHEWLNRRNNQIQRDVVITKKEFVDKDKIRTAIDLIKYPIYHLDFESFPCPLPRFKGERAYMQSLFQFSLHIEVSPGVCDKERDHYEFLAYNMTDLREELVEKLCHLIKDDGGSVLVYNQAFEKTRIKELEQFFPKYSKKLLAINERLFDLMHIVKTNSKLYENIGFGEDRAKQVNYYHEDLCGSYSIKKVLPIFSELTYQGMEIGNGMEAVYAYAGFKGLTEAELQVKRHALTLYCQQDTWAMVEILDNLRKI